MGMNERTVLMDWGIAKPKVLRKAMCEECPHKDMHKQVMIVPQYLERPHPCHMRQEYACRGAYLELKLRDCLDAFVEMGLDTENGI